MWYKLYVIVARVAGQISAKACAKHYQNVVKFAVKSKAENLPLNVAVIYDDLCRKKWAHEVAVGERNPDGTAAFDVEREALVFDQAHKSHFL